MSKPTLAEIEALEKARALEQKLLNAEANRRYRAIQLGICPECGAPIISELYEKYDVPKRYFFGLIKREGETWDYRKICSNDKNHYEEKWYRYPY